MDLKVEANRTDCLHICHVDTDKLGNGTASIVTLTRTDTKVHREFRLSETDEMEAFIDQRGYFRCIDDGSFIMRDNWELE